MKNKNDSGRSLIEMIMYLALVGVLSVSAISLYTKNLNNVNMLKLGDQVNDIQDKIKTIYMGQEFPQRGVINSDLQKYSKDLNLTDPWGHIISVKVEPKGTTSGIFSKPYFELQVSNLDKAKCIQTANKLITIPSAITVGVNVLVETTEITDDALPSIEDIRQKCKDNDYNQVKIWFVKE